MTKTNDLQKKQVLNVQANYYNVLSNNDEDIDQFEDRLLIFFKNKANKKKPGINSTRIVHDERRVTVKQRKKKVCKEAGTGVDNKDINLMISKFQNQEETNTDGDVPMGNDD